eukprot:10686568-Prorocentrum_lima.AAC.1
MVGGGSPWTFESFESKTAAAESMPRGEPVTPENFRDGARVARGPDWKWGDQDGGVGGVGILSRD